ncbi:MAG TPA: hypothetical protein VNA24_15920, partial [Hyalangium sp.]|nr:hypothetical protein [Hyalangium sp.]
MIRCSALCALALVLTAQVALAQKVPKARVAVLDFDDDRRDAVRGQLENALEKNKQLELVPLKQYVTAANKARLRGAASRSPEGVAQIAPMLGLSAVVTGKVGRTLVLRVLDANGQELWTKSVKLQRGKLPASEARKLAASIASAATQPPPSAQPPPEQPAQPATPDTPSAAPAPTPPAPAA